MLKKWLNKWLFKILDVAQLYDLFEAERKRRDATQLAQRLDRIARANAANRLAEIRKQQNECSHRKGGRICVGPVLDYAVAQHTFIDASKKTWCMLCKKQFFGDEAETMLRRTTNTPTSSQVVYKVKDQKQPYAFQPGGLQLENGPFSPWMSQSLWNRLTLTLTKLKTRRKKKLTS